MGKVFILFFAMTRYNEGNYPVTQFQQIFTKQADCEVILTKLKLDAARHKQIVLIGHCTEIAQ